MVLLVFDVDDTLLETFNHSFGIFEYMASKKLDKEVFLENYKKENGFEKNLNYFFADKDINQIKEQYISIKVKTDRKIFIDKKLFEQLKQRWYKFGILTNWPGNKTMEKLRQIWFKEGDFEIILHWDNLEYRKPDPRAFEQVLEKFDGKEVVYIGDSLDDLRAAQGAGVKFIGVLTWLATLEDFKSNGISEEIIFSDVNKVLEWLEKNHRK